MIIEASAPAKVILFGEHAVVYDKLGVATSVDKRCSVRVSYGKNNGVLISSKDLGLREYLTEKELADFFKRVDEAKKKKEFDKLKDLGKKDKLAPSLFVTAGIMERYGFKPVEISIESQIPKNMGSSSSVFSAISLGVSKFLGKDLSKKEISGFAYEGDVIAHGGTPSGIDTSIVTYGGYLKYRKSEGLTPLDIKLQLPLIFVDSGEPTNTSESVRYVRELKNKHESFLNSVFDNLDSISTRSLSALENQDIKSTGRLMTEYYQELRKLNISTQKLDRIIDIAASSEALGAKPTGSWGGGCCIVLAKDQEQASDLLKIYKENNFNSFQAKIGVEGVKEIK